MNEVRKCPWGAKALGKEVKNDIEDARVLSQALPLAKEGEVRVPVYNEDVEHIKELMSYYQFTTKQMSQQKNHLEALESKDGDKFTIKELKKSIKDFQETQRRVIEQIQTIIDTNEVYKNNYEDIKSIMGVGQIGAIALLYLF